LAGLRRTCAETRLKKAGGGQRSMTHYSAGSSFSNW
jgi:hypothetical protein